MSIQKVHRGDIETFTLLTNPKRTITSSSLAGMTGSIYVFPRHSHVEKELSPLSSFVNLTHDDSDLSTELKNLQNLGHSSNQINDGKLYGMINGYMNKVNQQSVSARKNKQLSVIRFTPSYQFTSNTLRKLIVKDVYNHYYKTEYPSANWAYTNYNTLNFFTGSDVPSTSVLLYPNIPGNFEHSGYMTGTYCLSGAFTFDFYINPRYQQDKFYGDYKAGTIFHLSSSYAISLISGSSFDQNGKADKFRIQLQLSHSADISPSLVVPGNYPHNLVFRSDDNSLNLNEWHHVIITWGTSLINNGTGSFNINGEEKGEFVIPSGTINLTEFATNNFANPDVLCIGNYYEGQNTGIHSLAYFFADDPALRDGLTQLINDVGGIDEPTTYNFTHPLNAEVHDLCIKRQFMNNIEIETANELLTGPDSINESLVSFYLPPFFMQESTLRRWVGDHGGILQTPFFEVDGTTDDPFNVAMSFGVAGHYINIENFLKDFASNLYPRCHHMTGAAIATTTDWRSANEFLYDQSFVVRRNLLIMPCDDGNFTPNYTLLKSESVNRTKPYTTSITSKYLDDLYTEDYSLINLDNLLLTSSLIFPSYEDSSVSGSYEDSSLYEMVNDFIGFTPEQPGLPMGPVYISYKRKVEKTIVENNFDAGIQQGAPLTIYNRTKDPSSNQVVFFDISNLYYGNQIMPGSVILKDSNISGSTGHMSITLKDDGHGNIYRADSISKNCTWNSVGNVYYDEGLIVIKSPHLYFFGKDQYSLEFKGDNSTHIMKLDIIADAYHLNSSSNPGYIPLSASSDITDPDQNFVYITGLNFHDDNMNVIAKASLAQPIMKRTNSKILFRTKFDF